MNYLSVCSGIEAATVAWHPLGWNPVAFSEIESFPSQVLKHHYPTVPNLGDMTKFKEWEIESNIDVFVGGTPCQSFSVAGLRKGLDDPRGNLMLTYLAIAKQHRPRWLVWENVPGVLSSAYGRDFGSFLGGLAVCGYGFAYRVLDAQYFGVAQRRRRVFVVGYLGDWRPAAAVLFERNSLQGNPAPSREKRESSASSIRSSPVYGGSDANTADTVTSKWAKGSGGPSGNECGLFVAQPLSYDMKQHHNPQPSDTVQLTTSNCATVRGDTPLVQPTYALQGNMIGRNDKAGPQGDGVNVEVCFTQNTTDRHAVAYNIAPGKGELKDDIHVTDAYIAKTIDASGSNPAMHQGGAAIVQPIAFSGQMSNPQTDVEMTQTLQAKNPMAVCLGGQHPNAGIGIDQTPTLTNAMGAGGGHIPITNTTAWSMNLMSPGRRVREDHGVGALTQQCHCPTQGNEAVVIQQAMAVRRLTPKECERLQGFPDNYTDIKSKNKPTPDGPRYKALGNSMAVPVMAWIGQRIQKVEDIIK
jgi:DNA (cytosine-5)-methyltransferase 1